MIVRVGLIGPGRSRTGYGIGQYVAREVLNYPKAKLVAFLGTSIMSLQQSVKALNCRVDIINKFQGKIYSVSQQTAFFNSPNLDLIIICSPIKTHERFIAKALLTGKHVLVEKPLLEESSLSLKQKIKRARYLIDLASRKHLFLTTNCQRVAAIEILNKKFGLPRHPSTINIELTIGAINKNLESPVALFELLIDHPLSFLVKYGITDYEAIIISRRVNKITKMQSSVVISGVYDGRFKKIIYKIKLQQLAKRVLSGMVVQLDNFPPVEISSFLTVENKIKTKYSTSDGNDKIIYSDDHLKTFLVRMIDAIYFNDTKHRLFISNQESFFIYCLREKLKSFKIFSERKERSRIYA